MNHTSTRAFAIRFLILLSCLALPLARGAEDSLNCSICGMHFKPGAPSSFRSTRDAKPIAFCSFSCAHRFHKKYPEAPLFAHDYKDGSRIDGKTAFYLIKSKNLLNLTDDKGNKVLDFDMPPSVVSFQKEADAKLLQSKLKDGEVIRGFDAMEKAYE